MAPGRRGWELWIDRSHWRGRLLRLVAGRPTKAPTSASASFRLIVICKANNSMFDCRGLGETACQSGIFAGLNPHVIRQSLIIENSAKAERDLDAQSPHAAYNDERQPSVVSRHRSGRWW